LKPNAAISRNRTHGLQQKLLLALVTLGEEANEAIDSNGILP